LQTARGTNTAFLFSMQSLPQLLQVGKGFKDDVTSAPNTKIAMRTQDEETSRFFIRASAEHTVTKRTVSVVREQVFGWERFQKGTSGSEREERDTEPRTEDQEPAERADANPHDDDTEGLCTVTCTSHASDVASGLEMELALRCGVQTEAGANLRFRTLTCGSWPADAGRR
jgi:hypothetical protein